eukprot:m.108082 g.108082  ORF g.108082 m.108082 type:complete len:626 (+) comp13949_c0_seq7:239-2116(+)
MDMSTTIPSSAAGSDPDLEPITYTAPHEENQPIVVVPVKSGLDPGPTDETEGKKPEEHKIASNEVPLEESSRLLQVHVYQEDGDVKSIPVRIIPSTTKKPFLGGYRHRETGLEYHHVSTQTYIPVRKPDGKQRFHRDVQVKQQSTGLTNTQQTSKNSATQMEKTGVSIDNREDKRIVPGKYVTADEWLARREQAALCLQSHLRRVFAQRRVASIRKRNDEAARHRRMELERTEKEKEDEWQRRVDRRLHPRTADDFGLLYKGLEVWRQEEMKKIYDLPVEEQTAAKMALLDKQVNYLGTIDNLKIEANKQNKDAKVKKFFEHTSAPRQWIEAEYGKLNQMDTPETLRAKELSEVYYALGLESLENDERLDVLLHTKIIVEEFESSLTNEIVSLLNREAELMLRKTKAQNLAGLRKRIRNLFLEFCEEPAFNPMAERYLDKHKPKETYTKDLIYCSSCMRHLDSGNFDISSVSKQTGTCISCRRVQNIAVQRNEHSQHRRLLEAIQQTEIQQGYSSQIVFTMSVEDMSYLADVIWQGQSVISQESELFLLQFARWDRNREFSPWNCVLLTKEEAALHEELHELSLNERYGPALIRLVEQKHLLASNYFMGLRSIQNRSMQTKNSTM